MKKISLVLLSSLILSTGAVTSVSAAEPTPKQEVEITPFVIFNPDRCITVDYVKTLSNGYSVIAKGGKKWTLLNAAKVGLKNPKTNSEVEIMLDIKGNVVGWKVL